MDGGRQTDAGVAEPSRASRIATIGWLLAALLTHLLLLDAAVETFWGGSPLRWWISPGLLAFMALSVWLWRPGGGWLRRHGPATSAMTPLFGLLAALAVTAWLPGGQAKGIRLMSQTTSTVLTLAAIPLVVLATFVILEAMALVPSRWRSIARAVFVLLCAYAVVALVAALRDRTPYPALFRGGAVWSRLPFWLQGTFVGLFGLVPVALAAQLGRFAARLKGHQPPRILGRQALALVLALAMSLPPVSVPGANVPGAAAAAQQARSGTAASWRPPAGQIRNLFRALDAATKRIDRTSFDPVAVVEKVGSGADALFVWVRDNTRWAPYRGALRGPVGVLMDRSGNSLDRALLLGELLQLGGHTARLARAQVPAATAEGWLARMPKRPVGPSAQAPPIDTLLASADSAAGESGISAADLRQVFLTVHGASEKLADEAARRATDYTRSVLENVGRPAEDDEAAGALLAALADHWWVQTLDNGQWSDLDPLLPDARPGLGEVAAQDTIPLSKPDGKVHLDRRYCQEVDLRVVAEQRRGPALTEHQALQETLRPSDLFGQPVSLQHEPVKWSVSLDLSKESDPLARLRAEALQQTEWLPILRIGPRQIEGSVIENTGRLKPKGGAGPAAMGGLGGFLGGGEGDTGTGDGVLTAVWLDYVIRVPGQVPRTIRRALFDLIGPAARASAKNEAAREPGGSPAGELSAQQLETRALAILDRVDVLVQGAKYAPEYVVHQGATYLLAQQDSVVSLVERRNAAPEDGREALDRLMPESAALLNLAVARFSQRFGSPAVFLDCPNILNWRSGLRFDGAKGPMLREFFDVAHNPVAPWPDSWPRPSDGSGRSADAFEVRVRQGVVDTVLEGALLADAQTRYSVPAFFDAASEQAIGTAAVRRGDPAGLARMGLPPDVAALAEAGLSDGCHLVLPARAVTVDGVPRFCWWRVDARSGDTVGVLDTGFHQGEYAQTLRVGVVKAVYREASKKAVRWVARRGFQFYNGWTAPPYMGSLCWDWGTIATFAFMGACLAGGIGSVVWVATSDP